MVDLVGLQREDLCQSASNLIDGNHGLQGSLAIDVAVHLGGGQDDRVEIVVAELASSVARDGGVVAEDGAVGVPLADGGGVGNDGLLGGALLRGAEDSGALGVGVGGQGLISEDGRGVGLQGERRDAAHDRVGVELLDALPHDRVQIIAILASDEVLGILSDAESLVAVGREGDSRRKGSGHDCESSNRGAGAGVHNLAQHDEEKR
mmetsp:Transcript_35263/g.52411  ORF Transcript_35263/g.52411 Transcript_35263/m.52411 type:complete len:206 (-) Transcript_35263:24-641(-)